MRCTRWQALASRSLEKAEMVVIVSPGVREPSGRGQALEHFGSQELATDAATNALRLAILPWPFRFDR